MNISEFARIEEENATRVVDRFAEDLFTARRSGAGTSNYGNPYDPESLITGGEVAQGLTYADKRSWANQQEYDRAVSGAIPTDQIPSIAPRVRSDRAQLV